MSSASISSAARRSTCVEYAYLLTHAGSRGPGWISEGPRGAKMAKYRSNRGAERIPEGPRGAKHG